MDLGLSRNTALITGAASGIGLASARAFAAEGCSLLLWDLAENVNSIGVEIASDFGVQVDAQVIDVSDLREVQRGLRQFASSGGSVQHVVHCAAIGSGKFGFPFTNLHPSDWGPTLNVNILGMVHIAHVLAKHLAEQSGGTFVFVASVAGQIGSQTDPPYSASKAANINFAQCMAKDLATHDIRVNTVCPGMVQTPLNRSVWQAWYDNAGPDQRCGYEDWARKKISDLVPLRRWQSCEDVASMIVFLSSERAGQVTGQTVNVDGGLVMHS